MEPRVKICGITRPEDAAEAVAAGADALGFVFVPGTPRCVPVELAARIVAGLPPFVSCTGLFVDAPLERILEVVAAARLDTVQLHGAEAPALAAALKSRVRVIKAFRVRGPESLASLEAYLPAAEAFLLDAHVPGAHGGTGARFDWELAVEARRFGKALILAGGLNPGNVAEAVKRVRPYALDVSSGVESSPGVKDPARLRAFVAAARSSTEERPV
jgi:phosphoribosylanthranilate isomerase